MKLRQAMIYAKDLPRMAAFYGETLGMREGQRAEGWVEFEGGVALHAIPAQIAEGIEIASPAAAREETLIKLIFAVGNVAAECARLEGLGVTVMRRPWGAADCLDPEGNVFQIASAG